MVAKITRDSAKKGEPRALASSRPPLVLSKTEATLKRLRTQHRSIQGLLKANGLKLSDLPKLSKLGRTLVSDQCQKNAQHLSKLAYKCTKLETEVRLLTETLKNLTVTVNNALRTTIQVSRDNVAKAMEQVQAQSQCHTLPSASFQVASRSFGTG
jgi:hypothetical protein